MTEEKKVPEEMFTPQTIPPFVIDTIQSLPEMERRVIELRLGFDEPRGSVPYGIIAQRLKCLPHIVRRSEQEALRKLREAFPLNIYESLRLTLGRWFGSDQASAPQHVA